MKTPAILAAALLIAAGSSFAADTNEAAADQAFRSQAAATGGLTRAQVKAETLAARKAGLLDINDAYPEPLFPAQRAKTPEVKSQLAAKQVRDGAAR